MALTKRQKQVLDFIANFLDENGYCPSYEEIARGLELASRRARTPRKRGRRHC